MSNKDFNKIFSDIFSGELSDNTENLTRAVTVEMDRIKETARQTLLEKQSEINKVQIGKGNRPQSVQKPLTKEESTLVDEKIKRLRSKLDSISRKLEFAEKSIISQQETDKDQPSFTFDISDKPRLRKFARIIFGERLNQITFAQYKAMLEEKQRLEKEDGNSMFEQEENDNVSGDAKDFTSLLKKK
jgi:hypothetical protein